MCIRDRAWTTILQALPGYRPAAAAGKVLMMTTALPWWRYGSVKASTSAQRKVLAA